MSKNDGFAATVSVVIHLDLRTFKFFSDSLKTVSMIETAEGSKSSMQRC